MGRTGSPRLRRRRAGDAGNTVKSLLSSTAAPFWRAVREDSAMCDSARFCQDALASGRRIPYNLIYLVQTVSGLGNCDANDWLGWGFLRRGGCRGRRVGITLCSAAEGCAGLRGASWPLPGAIHARESGGWYPGERATGRAGARSSPGRDGLGGMARMRTRPGTSQVRIRQPKPAPGAG